MDDLRGNDLKVAYWINTHRQEVYAVVRIVGIAVVILIWLMVLIQVVIYAKNYSITERALSEAGKVRVIYDSVVAPKDLVVLARAATPHSDTAIDVYAIIENPNQFYAGRFSYSFTIQGVTRTFDTGLIMPEETTYLVVNNVVAPKTASVEVELNNVIWQRVRGPEIEADFQVADLALSIGELAPSSSSESSTVAGSTTLSESITEPTVVADDEFVIPTTEPVTDDPATGVSFTQLTAKITNASAYGFERVRIMAILRNEQSQIVGVQQVVWSNVGSFTTLPLEINWIERFAFNTKPELFIQTDKWDRANLILPGEN